MFTGIVEAVGRVRSVRAESSNRVFTIEAHFIQELRVDQSVAHNGVCLTVTTLLPDAYEVVAVKETLEVSTLSALQEGDPVNLERAMVLGTRIDGHLVQGHVDAVSECMEVADKNGSWHMEFSIPKGDEHLLVYKGSICVNGISLTVAKLERDTFTVAVIPYTYEHTTLGQLRSGDRVNLEYDVLGKYVARLRMVAAGDR